jgi:hypothetical protein
MHLHVGHLPRTRAHTNTHIRSHAKALELPRAHKPHTGFSFFKLNCSLFCPCGPPHPLLSTFGSSLKRSSLPKDHSLSATNPRGGVCLGAVTSPPPRDVCAGRSTWQPCPSSPSWASRPPGESPRPWASSQTPHHASRPTCQHKGRASREHVSLHYSVIYSRRHPPAATRHSLTYPDVSPHRHHLLYSPRHQITFASLSRVRGRGGCAVAGRLARICRREQPCLEGTEGPQRPQGPSLLPSLTNHTSHTTAHHNTTHQTTLLLLRSLSPFEDTTESGGYGGGPRRAIWGLFPLSRPSQAPGSTEQRHPRKV